MAHQIPELKCVSSWFTVVFAQSIEASCEAENEDVVGAVLLQLHLRDQNVYCLPRCDMYSRWTIILKYLPSIPSISIIDYGPELATSAYVQNHLITEKKVTRPKESWFSEQNYTLYLPNVTMLSRVGMRFCKKIKQTIIIFNNLPDMS